MKIVGISDTHQYEIENLPKGDMLIHAGDFCSFGTEIEVHKFLDWFKDLEYESKILIAGNHDRPLADSKFLYWFEKKCERLGINYLMDSGIEINGIKFWGSPWQPEFNNWAFNLPRGLPLDEKWNLIPDDTDILITHGPPYGILDECPDMRKRRKMCHVGCGRLRKHVEDRLNLKAHFFGHIHESHGVYTLNNTKYFNLTICDGRFRPFNEPAVYEVKE